METTSSRKANPKLNTWSFSTQTSHNVDHMTIESSTGNTMKMKNAIQITALVVANVNSSSAPSPAFSVLGAQIPDIKQCDVSVADPFC
eukprot:scaffold19_cov114-Cylindrotheca_fusiformis.AAC.22